MNRHEALAIVLAGTLAVGAFGGTVVSAAGTASSAAPTATDDPAGVQDGVQNDTVSLVEAMEVAANATADRNGTVVGGERVQAGGFLADDEDAEVAYTVNVVFANGTHIQMAVNGTNGSVVNREEQDEGFLEDIFGEDEVPDQPLNLSAMYNATEAVQLAQNETDVNGTVTSVELDQQNDTLVYEVEFERADDEDRTVVVTAMKDGDGVVETETGDE